jgi:sulfite reductase beta subunit-like hemoprotein
VNSKALGKELQGLALPVSLHISGCQNGCSQHLTAPLSLQGTVRSSPEGRQPAYQLRVGRPVDGSGLRFGPVLGTVAARRVRPALESLLERWQDAGGSQPFDIWLEARGSAGIAADLGPLLKVPGPDLWKDNGSNQAFEVALGGTECH